ncbi:bifunctional DNA-formamidopyrimidine glycosylase/DNA-(apurinic or apyrimidinic site) lyase [Nesterenkonia sp. NBAIMH1]|uniref:bifunctional DNA-formamidopyrimidine glycosylase/DNA-(apurinic or apyrimidinic site) lyase n=1 Tax=Nesterenkonia sp. NBAIMH1 TaxID=2600320 RepID=UPI0011B7CD80|nr:bifunctional DNA-formamidopyrimidine glycosylase/DNA-(apurinic or apyrimidinic site) lyase [Nesterenkonia sp. NBAIMH1]
MPELPEVEVVRRGVESWAAGRTVTGAEIHDARSLRRYAEGPEHFRRELIGRTLLAPERRGKFLWIPLAGGPDEVPGRALMIHLGMSGQVLMEAADAPLEKHLKVTLHLGAGTQRTEAEGAVADQLRFVDQRIFGGMQISPLVPDSVVHGVDDVESRRVPAAAAHIAPDPLEAAMTAERFFRILRGRRTGLKRALLDQAMVSGVGNIYADEALWRSRLHYARRTETMTRAQASLLLTSLQDVMGDALAAGGTSFDALYVNVNGASGYFDRSLSAYGQEGRRCPRCMTPIRREKFMGRSSYFCPTCQPVPQNARW